jgi:hypothetical protein
MHNIEDINAWSTRATNSPVIKMNYDLSLESVGHIKDVVFSGYSSLLSYGSSGFSYSGSGEKVDIISANQSETMLYRNDNSVLFKTLKYARAGSNVPTGAGVGVAFGRNDASGDKFDAAVHTTCAYGDAVGSLMFSVRKSGETALEPRWFIQAQTLTTGDLFCFRPYVDNQVSLGRSGYRVSQVWAATGSIQTSDERMKQQIATTPDAVLDAWGDVEWKQYKFNDSVKDKGENARLHSGVIAQQIEAIFASHGLNAFAYGLIGHDIHEALLDENGNEIEPSIDQYSVRYDECLAMEAAYQRRRADRLEHRLEQLEKRVNQLTRNTNN